MTTIPREAFDITIAVLNTTHELHHKSCFEDISGRPLTECECCCPVKEIVDKLFKLPRS